jgi:phosphatidylglycerophosphate synthase
MTAELQFVLIGGLIVVCLGAGYGVRLAVKGRVHFDRVDRQGSSRLLAKTAMELNYWALEPVAKVAVFLGVTPNQLSWTSLGFGFVAGACLAFGYFGFGAICSTISGLLDCLDGMVARITGAASDAGEILDAAVDRYGEFFFMSGLIIYYRQFPIFQVLALIALIGGFMVSYSTAKAEALSLKPPPGGMRRPERALYLNLGAALSTITIPWLENDHHFLPIGYPMVSALALVAVLANVSSIERFRSIAKTIRSREKDLADAPSENREESRSPTVQHRL